ncbi:MAG: Trk system potassium transporter TrkA [Saprospiraceae bacterium]|nr:Trk system potassium transporter TrkA [Saprospiraceae bacterium]
MKIVIAGAGDTGFHLARLLSIEQQDIVLIDTNVEVLEYAATHLDVQTIPGDSASLAVLQQAEISNASLFMAMTTSEKNNLVSCILAKKMGARQTIARVSNHEYLADDQRASFQELGIDALICPTQLAAQECLRLVQQSTVTDLFEFEQGTLTLAGISLDDSSPLVNLTFQEISDQHGGQFFRPIAIQRGDRTIIPQPDTVVRRHDHIYFFAKSKRMQEVLQIAGKNPVKVRNIMVVGGTELGMKTAQLLEQDYNVVIVDKDKERCKRLAKRLKKTLVIQGDPNNIELLKEEGLEKMDAFIALTPNSETNIVTSLLAEESGVHKTIALVDNMDYMRISQNIGVDTIINKKLIAANNVFRYVRKGKIEAIASLHGVDAEIIEFAIHKENRLTRKPLGELHLPDKAIVAGIIRDHDSLFPDEDSILQKDDKVIVFAQHEAISKVEKLFR